MHPTGVPEFPSLIYFAHHPQPAGRPSRPRSVSMPQPIKEKPKPFLFEEYCKGCGRCISACAKHCIELGTEINAKTGVAPVHVNLETCNACGLCFDACPEPYGLMPWPA